MNAIAPKITGKFTAYWLWADNKENKKALIICDTVVGGSPPYEPTHTTTDVKGKCFPCHGIIKYNAEMQWNGT